MNRKGLIPASIARFLKILGGGIIVLLLVLLALNMFMDPSMDTSAEIHSNVRDFYSLDPGLGLEIRFWPRNYENRAEDITPDNLKDCDQFYEDALNYAASDEEEAKALKDCAMQQVAELARRCWKTRGHGTLDPGNSNCFIFCIKNYDVPIQFSFKELGKFMRTNNVSRTSTPYKKAMNLNTVIPRDKQAIKNNIVWQVNFNDGWAPGWDLEWLGWDLEYDMGDYIVFERVEDDDGRPLRCGLE